MRNTLDQKKHVNCSVLPSEHSKNGAVRVRYQALERKEDIADSSERKSSLSTTPGQITGLAYATVESLPGGRKKIWKDRLSTSELNILTMKLCLIMDQDSTLKDENFRPWWTEQSREISEKLWLPTKIDCVDSVLSSSKELSRNTPMGQSWFSINKRHPPKKSLSMTSFQSSQYSLPDSTDSEVVPLRERSERHLKTLKMRIFPTQKEKEKLDLLFKQQRWYYNATLNIVGRINKGKEPTKKLYFSSLRDLLRTYEYTEKVVEREGDVLVFQSFEKKEGRNEMFEPYWWNDIHSRIPRGAIKKFVGNVNSSIENKRNGNINHFKLGYASAKGPTEFLHFEDLKFPAFIKKIKSRYWYRTKSGKRKSISFLEIFKGTKKRGIEIVHDKIRDIYMLHYPVEVDWYPPKDRRSDNQAAPVNGDTVIALDPGIRKFMVGYDPSGHCLFVGDKDNHTLMNELKVIDSFVSLKDTIGNSETLKLATRQQWQRIKGMVDDLHWKTINYLTDNYKTILYPDFRISGMVKGKKLHKSTKRMMYMYSFFKFKQRLEWKCQRKGVNLLIVDESYTSKTCTCCGKLNDTKGKETLCCFSCETEVDRDAAGARNILIKNTRYTLIPSGIE